MKTPGFGAEFCHRMPWNFRASLGWWASYCSTRRPTPECLLKIREAIKLTWNGSREAINVDHKPIKCSHFYDLYGVPAKTIDFALSIPCRPSLNGSLTRIYWREMAKKECKTRGAWGIDRWGGDASKRRRHGNSCSGNNNVTSSPLSFFDKDKNSFVLIKWF